MTARYGSCYSPPMHTTVTTTISTDIDLETFEPTHSVDIQAEDILPTQVIYAAALGGSRAAAASLEGKVNPGIAQECDDDEPTPENPSESGV